MNVMGKFIVGVHHHGYVCDSCHAHPIRGMRWRCLNCADYDLCSDCYMRDKHDLDHAFERHQGNKSIGYVLYNEQYYVNDFFIPTYVHFTLLAQFDEGSKNVNYFQTTSSIFTK
jgi:hypothetical protein